ncbi:MAG TPA: TraB/GumN family protein [Micropepsaceae bacterium]|jgi:hypothetical protein
MRVRELLKAFLSAWATAAILTAGGAALAATKSEPGKITDATHGQGSPSPALWKIVNGKSTVYFLGSIHLLPEGFSWHTPAIDKAIKAADAFVFEADLDFGTAEFHYYMDNYGYLPRGQTLHQMLSPAAQKQYFTLIRDMQIDLNKLDYLQPGLAVLLLDRAFIGTHASRPLEPGVDAQLVYYAKSHAKELHYLESLQSQFDVLAKIGGGAQAAVLEKKLLSREKNTGEFGTMVAAWVKGDLPKLISMDDMDPKERILTLDNRNRAWQPKIEAMLEDGRTYLVTVGTAHLAGPNSVISLLCAKHWKLERIQTGSTPPPPACADDRKS